jgi:hypothetical protein
MAVRDDYPTLYDFGNLAVPPRSVLYRLEPVALGTSRRESLTSYLDRLADAHCVSIRALGGLAGVETACRKALARGVFSSPCFNAGGIVSLKWVSIVERLTTQTGLHRLTLAPIARVVNQRALVGRLRRWCPECLRESRNAGTPYGHLLWDLACVAACPIHELRLSCSCNCQLSSQPRRVREQPGVCTRCSRRIEETSRTLKASSEELRIARLAYDFLGDPRFDSGGWHQSDDCSGEFLSAAARIHFEGKPAWLAKAFGVSKGGLHGWMSGKHRPSFGWYLGVADLFNCSVTDVLNGFADDTTVTDRPSVKLFGHKSPRTLSAEHRSNVAAQLPSCLNDSHAKSLTALATELGVSTDFLRDYFPRETRLIVANYKARLSNEKNRRRSEILAACRRKAEELARNGIKPTSRRVLQGTKLQNRFASWRSALNEIIFEARAGMLERS